jgi:probable rRNA maturation factor
MEPMSLEIDDRTKSADIDSFWLNNRYEAVCRHLKLTRCVVAMRLVDSEEMGRAHEQFCGVAGPTDVLTFAGPCDPDGGIVEADVLVCLDVARTEAAHRSHPVQEEVLLYLIHAMLHCLGHDDHDEVGFGRMHGLEDAILESIGVGRRFDD